MGQITVNQDEYKDLKLRVAQLQNVLEKKQREIEDVRHKSMKLIQEKTAHLREENRHLQKAYQRLRHNESDVIQKERWISIGQLAAGVAHEINNPLGFVENNLYALQLYVGKFREMLSAYFAFYQVAVSQGVLGDDCARLSDKINQLGIDQSLSDLDLLFEQSQDGIKRISDIISSLKTFSRNSKSNDTMAEYNVNMALENAIVICQNEHKYHADIVTEYGDLPPILCDSGKLGQVFLNLIVNASHAVKDQHQASGERGIITIRTYEKNGYIYCEVEDNGPGIPVKLQRKIFDPFFTTKEVNDGTGLGLSISLDIVHKHNGDIYLESDAGRGSTFIVRLPVRQVESS